MPCRAAAVVPDTRLHRPEFAIIAGRSARAGASSPLSGRHPVVVVNLRQGDVRGAGGRVRHRHRHGLALRVRCGSAAGCQVPETSRGATSSERDSTVA
jgi:hypothetical protein